MDAVCAMILAGEDQLLERVLRHAIESGYSSYTSTLKEAWRVSVAGLSRALCRHLESGAPPLGPEDADADDPVVAFAVAEAHLHRRRGVTLSMFLGLLTYYRKAYLDLLAGSAAVPASGHERVLGFFDRLGIAIAQEWAAIGDVRQLEELGRTNRALTSEKNRYQTVFESLETPVLLLDPEFRVLNINFAGARLLLGNVLPGAVYYASGSSLFSGVCEGDDPRRGLLGREAGALLPWLAAELDAFAAGGGGQACCAKDVDFADEGLIFEVCMARMLDCSGTCDAVVVTLHDITARTLAERELLEIREGLRRRVEERTSALEEANRRLALEVHHKKQVEEALRQGAALYRAVVEQQSELVCRFSAADGITFANSAFLGFFGLARETGRFRDLLPAEAAGVVADFMRRAGPEAPELDFEHGMHGARGGERWLRWSVRALPGEAGAPVEFQAVGRDDTQRRAAESELRRLNEALEARVRERARAFEERARQLACLYEVSRLVSVPDAGSPGVLSQIVGVVAQGFGDPGEAVVCIEHETACICSETGVSGDAGLKRELHVGGRATGCIEVRRLPGSGSPAGFSRSEEELVEGVADMLGLAIERSVSEHRVRSSEAKFHMLFDHAGDAIFVHALDGTILDANAVACRRLGYEREELVGKSLAEIDSPAMQETVSRQREQVLHQGRAFFEAEHVARDGRVIPVEVSARLVRLDGRDAVLSLARDISERREASRAMSRRLRMERIVAEISTLFLAGDPEEADVLISHAVAQVGEFADVQRASVCLVDAGGHTYICQHEWRAANVGPSGAKGQRRQLDRMPWWAGQMRGLSLVSIASVEDLPPEAAAERRMLEERGVVTLLAAPMAVGERLLGWVSMESGSHERFFGEEDQNFLETLAGIFSGALERRRAAHERDRHEAFVTASLNSLSAHVAVLDADGTILRVNNAWTSFVGSCGARPSSDYGPGAAYLEVCDRAAARGDSLAAEAAKGIRDVLAGDSKLFSMEYPCHSPGQERWFLMQATPLGLARGGAVVSHVDISGRMLAEQNLVRSEARYRTLVESMHEGLVITDSEGGLIYTNERFCRMLGRSRDELLHARAVDLVEESSRARAVGIFERREQGEARSREVVWHGSSGARVFSIVSPSGLSDEDGGFAGTLAVITDLTERKMLESQLVQAQKLESIGQLAAGIAHEINTPAQYVGNNVLFLKQAMQDIASVCGGSAEVAEAARLAEVDLEFLMEEIPRAIVETEEGIERISTIVKSVKQFAHPGSDHVTPTDINKAVESTATVARNEWKYVADLILDLEPELPPVPCVPAELGQVVLNLIINAVHAIQDKLGKNPPAKGRIGVSTRLDGEWIEIGVADSGNGIPEAIRSKIFNPFFTTKEPGRGTGQGLAIAHTAIVEKLGGQISFETQSGEGTTFRVRLPLAPSQGRA